MESQLQLRYAFPTQPSPLEAGVKVGRLNVVVSSVGRPHYCSRLNIYLPVGKGAEYLSAFPPIASVNTTGWVITPASPAPQEQLPPDLQALGVYFLAYHCLPATAENELIGDDLEFRFEIEGVDESPGLFPIGIHEFVATEKGGEPSSRTGTFYRRKAEPSFFLRNLVASAASGDVNVPLGRIAAGVPFRLNWESNGTTYRIFTEGSIPLYTGSDTQFLLHEGIQADTTFVLQAEVPGGQGGGSGFETEYLYAALTVCCSNADLHVHSLTSAGAVQAEGPVLTSAGITAQGEAALGSLRVAGESQLSNLVASGDAQVRGLHVGQGLHVSGETRLLGKLKVQGMAELEALESKTHIVPGELSVRGPLAVSGGAVQMFASPTLVIRESKSTSKEFVAPTDGYLLGVIALNDAGRDARTSTVTLKLLSANSPASGLTMVADLPTPLASAPNEREFGSTMLPVRKGDHVSIKIAIYPPASRAAHKAQGAAYFYGFGVNGA